MSSMTNKRNLVRRSPLGELMEENNPEILSAPIQFRELTAQQVQISPFKDRAGVVDQLLLDNFGISLPPSGRYHSYEGKRVAWVGLNHWMVQDSDQATTGLYTEVTDLLKDVAAVTDQGHARCMLEISGERAVDLLKRHCQLNLDSTLWATAGTCAMTDIAHMSGHLLRLSDSDTGSPRFEVQVFRSFAASLWHELSRTVEVLRV